MIVIDYSWIIAHIKQQQSHVTQQNGGRHMIVIDYS